MHSISTSWWSSCLLSTSTLGGSGGTPCGGLCLRRCYERAFTFGNKLKHEFLPDLLIVLWEYKDLEVYILFLFLLCGRHKKELRWVTCFLCRRWHPRLLEVVWRMVELLLMLLDASCSVGTSNGIRDEKWRWRPTVHGSNNWTNVLRAESLWSMVQQQTF